jgi:hypothetical protein
MMTCGIAPAATGAIAVAVNSLGRMGDVNDRPPPITQIAIPTTRSSAATSTATVPARDIYSRGPQPSKVGRNDCAEFRSSFDRAGRARSDPAPLGRVLFGIVVICWFSLRESSCPRYGPRSRMFRRDGRNNRRLSPVARACRHSWPFDPASTGSASLRTSSGKRDRG